MFIRRLGQLELGAGTPFAIEEEEGLESLVVRTGTRPLPRADGSIPGLHRVDSKRIILRGYMVARTPEELEDLWETFVAHTEPGQSLRQYRFTLRGKEERFVWARVIDRPSIRNVETEEVGLRRWTLGLEVADPRIYSVEQFSTLVPIWGTAGGGFDLPTDLPFGMTPAGQIKAVAVHNGSSPAFPTLQFAASGIVTSLLLVNETNGTRFEMGPSATNTPFGLSAGQTLIADLGAYVRSDPTVLPIRIGNASRFGHWQLPREPLWLSPGSNRLRFEHDGDVVCLLTWRSTFGGSADN